MALDPKSAATIAKIAIQSSKDDETRNRIIFISVLLILAFIVYILTNPIEMLSGIFLGNKLNQVKNIRSRYGCE